MNNYLFYCAIVSVCTEFIRNQRIFDVLNDIKFLKEMRSCRICTGFWVSFGLYFVFGFPGITNSFNIIDGIITAIVTTLLLHYLIEGWKGIHQTIIMK